MEQNYNEIIVLKEKTFNIISDKNIEYSIILSIDSNDIINLIAYPKKNLYSKKYSLSCSLEDLQKNRFFKIFLGVEEIYRELENKIQQSKIIEETNIIYLDIPIGLTVINDIILEIREKEKSIEDLKYLLNQQIEYNKNLENELLKKDEIIKKLNNKINILNNKINYGDLSKSSIVKNIEIDMIKNWINSEKNINFKLLYKATIDGDKIKQMHKKIDNKGENIIFCFIENGCRYGG